MAIFRSGFWESAQEGNRLEHSWDLPSWGAREIVRRPLGVLNSWVSLLLMWSSAGVRRVRGSSATAMSSGVSHRGVVFSNSCAVRSQMDTAVTAAPHRVFYQPYLTLTLHYGGLFVKFAHQCR